MFPVSWPRKKCPELLASARTLSPFLSHMTSSQQFLLARPGGGGGRRALGPRPELALPAEAQCRPCLQGLV